MYDWPLFHVYACYSKTMIRNFNLNEPDLNIVKALKEIKWPIKNYEGRLVYLRERRGDINNTINHIARKNHYLKVRDIKAITTVLKNPIKIIKLDRKKNKIYFGKRPGGKGNDNKPYLKIVINSYKNIDYIATIYPEFTLN